MPIHDWTRVDAGIFHDFHHAWIEEIKRALNRGLLPPDHYALAEQIAGGVGPDVLTLQVPANGPGPPPGNGGGVALASVAPKVYHRQRAGADAYVTKAKAVAIRHVSDHRVVALIEIVSPGNKTSRHGLRAFVEKAAAMLRAGVHLLIVDLFPPSIRDPQGMHRALWDEVIDNEFQPPPGQPLTAAAYIGGACPEAFVQPLILGQALPEMPVFLTEEIYISLPLEPTYHSAFEAVPAYWRQVMESSSSASGAPTIR